MSTAQHLAETKLAAQIPALDRLAYPVEAASVVCGLSRSRLYELFATGELRSVKRGGRRLVLKQDLEDFLRGEAA